ncbi:YbbR-like protein [compost metagenome]
MTRLFATRDESNSGLRVIALLMAIALWLFVGPWQRIETGVRKITLPIDVKNGRNEAPVRIQPAHAEVTIEGPRKAIEHLEEGQLEAFVDLRLRGHHPSRYPVHVSVPPGVRYQVIPSEVHVVTP